VFFISLRLRSFSSSVFILKSLGFFAVCAIGFAVVVADAAAFSAGLRAAVVARPRVVIVRAFGCVGNAGFHLLFSLGS
jgi:hypothetical protein